MTVPATVIDRAIELHERALAAASQARWSEAEQAALESLKLIEAEDGPESPDAANVCNLLSRIAEARTDHVDAERHARRAWEIMEQLGSRCTGREAGAIRIEALGRIGTALRSAGRYGAAEIWLRKALELAQRDGQQVAGALNDLGMLQIQRQLR